MIYAKLYTKNGTLLCNKYNRVVHGKRGDYIEIELSDIIPKLVSKYGNNYTIPTNDFYYYWLTPINEPETKIYYQQKEVKYADYKKYKCYISPLLIKDFKDPESLF